MRDICKIGNLSLGYKTFIDREPTEKDLEICKWHDDGKTKYTIASFDYKKEYKCYVLRSCLDRLKDFNIDWCTFGFLVHEAYRRLEGVDSL
jgi:hypothetical protein